LAGKIGNPVLELSGIEVQSTESGFDFPEWVFQKETRLEGDQDLKRVESCDIISTNVYLFMCLGRKGESMKTMVQCLKALADENRLRILMLLRERELCGFEIMGVLELSQPLVSSHLGVLRAAGLVEARREGKRMRYAITETGRVGGKRGIVNLVTAALEAEPVVAKDLARLKECDEFRKGEPSCDRETVARFRKTRGRKR
jgi:DNA-binding transcriptional ArsR family regulator